LAHKLNSHCTQQARILARQFKELPEKEVRKWAKKAEGDKARYQEEMKDYVPVNDPDGGGKKSKKAKKDPNAPKRNMSAYFLYSIAVRPSVKEENADASFGEIARLISARFKALSEKERKVWDDKAGMYNMFSCPVLKLKWMQSSSSHLFIVVHSRRQGPIQCRDGRLQGLGASTIFLKAVCGVMVHSTSPCNAVSKHA
jgi:HMG (high mobility group) box